MAFKWYIAARIELINVSFELRCTIEALIRCEVLEAAEDFVVPLSILIDILC